MKVIRVIARRGTLMTVFGHTRFIDLRIGEGDDRLIGDNGQFFARRSPDGTWFDPSDKSVILKLELEDD